MLGSNFHSFLISYLPRSLPHASAPMDQLHINALRCYGYTGYLPEETRLGQWFEVSLTLWLDLAAASQSDRLDDTADYRQVIEAVRGVVEQEVFKTVERLAGAIAQTLLDLKVCQQVQVRLTKLSPPIPNFSGSITVELTRSLPAS